MPVVALGCIALLGLGWAVSMINGFGIVFIACALLLGAAPAVEWLDRWLQRDRLA